MSLPLTRLFRTLLWMYWRTFLGRLADIRQQSRLLLSVLGGFVLGYLFVGYYLFFKGLTYVNNFPVVGTLLSQRILFLIFGFFFVMLIFSNIITGYTTFFKNRETAWFLTLPIRHRHVFLWKFFEALFVSSWALIFLSAPLMAAYGRVNQVAPAFYVQVAMVYVPFVVLPSVIGSWLILLIVRFLARSWMKKVLIGAAVLLVVGMFLGIRPTSETGVSVDEDILSFEQLLRHTRVSLHPVLPSSWMAQSVLSLSQGLSRQGYFYFALLLSNALFGMVLSYELAGRFFYRGWSFASSTRTESHHLKSLAKRERRERPSLVENLVGRIPGVGRPAKALLVKDLRVFWRDPAQWTQFAVFFGLLCIYILNLRNVAYDFKSEFWGTVISYLNLGASALTLSTLTTRFVFPQFSLEGRRLWIVGLAPIGLQRVLLHKFAFSAAGSMAVTVTLMVASSLMLQQNFTTVLYFAGAIAVMSASLSGLAVGLGALFPNMKEDNPSKIVSGFGGTLCLVVSFIYILVFISLLALPSILALSAPQAFTTTMPLIQSGCVVGALLASAAVLGVPLALALHRLKTLEF